MYERLVPRIDRIEQEGPIEADSVDLTVGDPKLLRRKYEGLFPHAQVTEVEVPMSADIIRTLLPNTSVVLARANDVWEWQELEHGNRLGDAMDVLGIDRMPVRQSVKKWMGLAGRLARVSPGVHDTIEYTSLVYKAMGELETLMFYPRWSRDLRTDGEIPLATLIGRIGRQEGGHLDLWRDAARERREALHPYQVAIARRIIVSAYMPVGTHLGKRDVERHRSFGRVASDIGGENLQTLIDPIERLAADLLDMGGNNLKPFVRKRYEQCIREYRESVAA